MALTYTQITETFSDGTGQPMSNINVAFAPSETVYAAGIPVVTPDTPITAQVVGGVLKSASGATLQLLDTSNSGLTIEGRTGFWFWTVTITGQLADSFSFFLPHSATPVDLYSLANTSASGGSGFTNPMTALGDLIDGGAAGVATRLAGDASNTRKFLRTQASGGVAQAPAWDTIQAGDVPALPYLPVAGGTLTGWLAPAVVALTFGASIAVNAALGNAFAVTLTASTGTLANPTNPVDGQVIRVRVIQDATGSRTLAYGTAYDFGSGSAPTLSTAASKVDILAFEYVASLSKWCYLGSVLGN